MFGLENIGDFVLGTFNNLGNKLTDINDQIFNGVIPNVAKLIGDFIIETPNNIKSMIVGAGSLSNEVTKSIAQNYKNLISPITNIPKEISSYAVNNLKQIGNIASSTASGVTQGLFGSSFFTAPVVLVGAALASIVLLKI